MNSIRARLTKLEAQLTSSACTCARCSGPRLVIVEDEETRYVFPSPEASICPVHGEVDQETRKART